MKANREIRDVEHLLPRIKKIIENIYDKRLVDIILYGSFARNDADSDSDIDIMLILKGDVDTMKEMNKIHNDVYEIELETGELISVYPVAEEEFNNSIWPLYYHVKKEGVKI